MGNLSPSGNGDDDGNMSQFDDCDEKMPRHVIRSCEDYGLSPSNNCYDNEVSPKELSGCREGATGKSAKRRMWGICHHMMGL